MGETMTTAACLVALLLAGCGTTTRDCARLYCGRGFRGGTNCSEADWTVEGGVCEVRDGKD